MITEKLFPIPKLCTSRCMIPLRKNNFRSLQIYLTFLTDLFDRYLTTRARGRRIKHVIRIFTGFTQLWNMILRWCNLRPKTPCNISGMLINAENTWSQFNICPGWISSELRIATSLAWYICIVFLENMASSQKKISARWASVNQFNFACCYFPRIGRWCNTDWKNRSMQKMKLRWKQQFSPPQCLCIDLKILDLGFKSGKHSNF